MRASTEPKNRVREWPFTLVLDGIEEFTFSIADALCEAGCDDATLCSRNGVAFINFDREAVSLPDAVLSGIRDVDRARVGARVVRIEPDDFASMSEIARRLGRSRESVRLLWSGRRGPGGFPVPVSGLTGTSPLWSFAEVAGWFRRHGLDDRVDEATCRDAEFVRAANRALAGIGEDDPERALRELASRTRAG